MDGYEGEGLFTIEEAVHGASGQHIAHNIYKKIISGQLEPGTKLAEVALAEQFKVSRGPVRDALRYLASIGLLSFTPNVGASVRVLQKKEARDLYEYRTALESEAAYLAAQRIDALGRERIAQLITTHTDAMAVKKVGGYVVQSEGNDFHSLVAQLSHNQLLIKALTQELYPQLALLRRQHKNVKGRGQVALVEHQRIAEAIQAGDAELAALLMRRHLQFSWLALESQL